MTIPTRNPETDPVEIDQSEPERLGEDRRPVLRFVGLGTELAGFTLVFAGIGHLLDNGLQTSKPYASALAALVGFTLGMVRFIQQVRT